MPLYIAIPILIVVIFMIFWVIQPYKYLPLKDSSSKLVGWIRYDERKFSLVSFELSHHVFHARNSNAEMKVTLKPNVYQKSLKEIARNQQIWVIKHIGNIKSRQIKSIRSKSLEQSIILEDNLTIHQRIVDLKNNFLVLQFNEPDTNSPKFKRNSIAFIKPTLLNALYSK